MQSRSSLKRAVAAVVAGVLIGGAVTTVTPAGAEVSQFAATNWKKIWKKKLQPQADKRYYSKTASDTKYSTKTEVGAALGGYYTKAQADAALGGYYTKAQTDAKYQPVGTYAAAGSSYTKAESDAKYAPYPSVIRGTTMQATLADAAGGRVGGHISWGVTLSAAPTPHYIPSGAPVPAGCSGTAAAPNAAAGHLCVFEIYSSNNTGNIIATPAGTAGATALGAVLFASSAGAGETVITTSWAVRPAGISTSLAATSSIAPGGKDSVFGR
jgi:hypothetical protein